MDKGLEEPLLERGLRSDYDGFLTVRSKPKVSLSIALNLCILALGIIIGSMPLMSTSRKHLCQDVYSEQIHWGSSSTNGGGPAQEAIEYRTQTFRTGLHDDITEYMGSSEEVLLNWEALYNDIGMSQIDQDSARRLPNATTPTSYDHSQYMVQLDVFHTLHCLNLLRKSLYPQVYPRNEDEESLFHLEHCVESIRQSLQCSSDISTIYWEWSETRQKVLGNLRTVHTCRNFEKIQAWARDHSLRQETDMLQHVPGAPLRAE